MIHKFIDLQRRFILSLHWPCERKLLQIEWLSMPADHPHNPTNKNKNKKKAYGGRNTNFTARPNGAKLTNLISNDASIKDYVNNDAGQLQNGGTNATLEIESIKKQIQQMNHMMMMMMMMYKGKGPTASDEPLQVLFNQLLLLIFILLMIGLSIQGQLIIYVLV